MCQVMQAFGRDADCTGVDCSAKCCRRVSMQEGVQSVALQHECPAHSKSLWLCGNAAVQQELCRRMCVRGWTACTHGCGCT